MPDQSKAITPTWALSIFQLSCASKHSNRQSFCYITMRFIKIQPLFKPIKNQSFYPIDVFLWKCALFWLYPPTINFLESWMHLRDGSAKVVTLSHHGMRASNDCLREIAVSSDVFENISPFIPVCFSSALSVLASTLRVSFWLMLSVWASVRCAALRNGCLVL